MIGAIEEALLARVRTAAALAVEDGGLGWTPARLGTYIGQWDRHRKRAGERTIAAAEDRFPAVLVAFKDAALDDTRAGGPFWIGRWSLCLAARGGRNQSERRLGSADRVGAYQMIEDMARLLHDLELGGINSTLAMVEPVALTAIDILHADQDSVVYSLEMDIAWPLTTVQNLGSFQTFHADWDLPPLGTVAPPLPAITPDAADTVHLEGA